MLLRTTTFSGYFVASLNAVTPMVLALLFRLDRIPPKNTNSRFLTKSIEDNENRYL